MSGLRPSRPAAAAGVFALALALRLLHLAAIEGTLLASTPFGDAAGYLAWAGRIAAGDLVGNAVFYQAPLYPYLLAAIRALFGDSLLAVRVVQSVAGAAGCALLSDAARASFGRGAGLATGVLGAVYAPAIFFDGLIQKTSPAFFLAAAALWLLLVTRRGAASGAAGVAVGLLSLTREPARLLPLVAAPWLLRARGARAAALFLAGFALVLLPVGLRNHAVGGAFLVSTSQAGPNLWIGNHAGASGLYEPLAPGRGAPEFERDDATRLAERAAGRPLTPAEVSAHWIRRSVRFARERPGEWLALTARKAGLALHAREIPDTEAIEAYRLESPVLALLRPLDFGLLVALALGGWIAAASGRSGANGQDRRARELLLATLALSFASVVLFFVSARYRFVLVPPLLPLAGDGLARGLAALGAALRRRTRPVGRAGRRATAPAVVALAAWAALHVPAGPPLDPLRTTWENLGGRLVALERPDEAEVVLRRALERDPGAYLAQYHLGLALAAQGRSAAARERFRAAAERAPAFAEAHYNLGVLLQRDGRDPDAASAFRRALDAEPDHAPALAQLGRTLLRLGRPAEAADALLRASAADPASVGARLDLALALAGMGQGTRAVDVLREARRLDPEDPGICLNLGLALATTRRLEESAAAFRDALALRPAYPEAHYNLGAVLARLGRGGEAIPHLREALRQKPDYAAARRALDRLDG